MTDQPKLFEGYEIQAEYLAIDKITGKLGLREYLPDDVETPASGDVVELTIRYKLGLTRGIQYGNDGNQKGEVADIWTATPIVDSIRMSAYMTREEDDANWREKHGAVGE